MALSVETLTWDCRSPEAIARFWAEVLGYEVVEVDDEDAEIRDPKGEGVADPVPGGSRGQVGEEPPPPRSSPGDLDGR